MKKTRINELARELEVKPNRILELLSEFGVTEKKTHSSSIDDDVADQIRRRIGGYVGAREMPADEVAEIEPESLAASAPSAAPVVREPVRPVAPIPPGTILTPPAIPATAEASAEAMPRRRAPLPIRPPLASTLAGRESAPTPRPPATEPPPLAAHIPAKPAAPAMAATPAPQQPARSAGIPAKPLPTPRPGQILSGPRQPFPRDVAPAPPRRPAPSRPPAPAPAQPAPQAAAAAKNHDRPVAAKNPGGSTRRAPGGSAAS